MTLRIEITGETPEELCLNAAKVGAIVMAGMQAARMAASVQSAAPSPTPGDAADGVAAVPPTPSARTPAAATPPSPESDEDETPAPRRRGRPPSGKKREAPNREAQRATRAKTPPAVDASIDDTPDFLDADDEDDGEGTGKVITLDDVREKVREYNRACEKRGTMSESVTYITPLFKKFGIKRVSDLKPDVLPVFYADIQPYIDGTA